METKFNIGDIIAPEYPSLYDRQSGGGLIFIIDIERSNRVIISSFYDYRVRYLVGDRSFCISSDLIDRNYVFVA